jgi:hypothetical protein
MIAYDEIIDGVVWVIVVNEQGEVVGRYRKDEKKQAA